MQMVEIRLWYICCSLSPSPALSLPLPKSLHHRRYRYLVHRIIDADPHGPQPASIIDWESGGVLPAMLPLYAASQELAPLAKLLQVIPAGTVQV